MYNTNIDRNVQTNQQVKQFAPSHVGVTKLGLNKSQTR